LQQYARLTQQLLFAKAESTSTGKGSAVATPAAAALPQHARFTEQQYARFSQQVCFATAPASLTAVSIPLWVLALAVLVV